jgi:photosystem I P700 chlorophyll a apoprotein A1
VLISKIKLLFRGINSTLYSKPGHFNKALSKGPSSTTFIWNLHADAHDFDSPGANYSFMASQEPGVSALVGRKVFSSNLAHLSLVFFWLGTMHVNGAYFSNYGAWLKDPVHCYPSAQIVSPLVHQDILNSDVGGFYFQGIAITSGLFQLWRAAGIVTHVDMQCACAASLIGTVVSLIGSYFHFHISYYPGGSPNSRDPLYRKFKSLCSHHLSLLFGLGSMAWAAHQYHIAVPINSLLDSHVDPASIPSPQDLLVSTSLVQGTRFSLQKITFSPQVSHHFYVAVVFILAGVLVLANPIRRTANVVPRVGLSYSWHAQLSVNLAVTGALSIVFAHHQSAIPAYPYYASDYPAVLSSFCHHIWLGSFLICGSACHQFS